MERKTRRTRPTSEQLAIVETELDLKREDLEGIGRDGDAERIAALRAVADFLEAEITRRHRRAAFRKIKTYTAAAFDGSTRQVTVPED